MYGKIIDYKKTKGVNFNVTCPVCKSKYVVDPLDTTGTDTEHDALITVNNPDWDPSHAYISLHMTCHNCNVPFHPIFVTYSKNSITYLGEEG